MPSFKFHIVTFGCKVNQYESQALRESWLESGAEEVPDPCSANYIFINSCAITGRAERDCRNAVHRLRKQAPLAKIILSGCAAQFYNNFKPRKGAPCELPDICVAQANKARLLASPIGTDSPRSYHINSFNRGRPVIKVQDGCSHNCSYCIVPQTRGNPSSREPSDILAECRSLAGKGYGELVISGINLHQYAKMGGFWNLLAYLDQELSDSFGKNLRLRISSIDPSMLNKDSIKIIAACKILCPHLHLSLQHASCRILKNMKRGHYDALGIMENIEHLPWPLFGLGADILVGFPGESAKDMDILLEYLDKAPFTYAHVFPFSKRQGTSAYSMDDQIPAVEKNYRARLVRELIEQKRANFWQKQLSLPHMRIAPDAASESRKITKGVNEFYVPCILERNNAGRGLIYVEPSASCLKSCLHRQGIPVKDSLG